MATKEVSKKTTPIRFTRLRIIKNLAVISCTFVLLFTAYDGLSLLQSTMNGKNGVGSASQAVVYTTFALSSLLLPKYTIKKIGCKMTLFLGTVLYLPYIAANAYPTWFAMMSSAALLGIGAGVLWAAQCTYFNEAAGMYCDIVEDSKKCKKSAAWGVRNLELFVIHNGVDGKTPLKPGLISEGMIVTHEFPGIHARTESKCSTMEVISEKYSINEKSDKNTVNPILEQQFPGIRPRTESKCSTMEVISEINSITEKSVKNAINPLLEQHQPPSSTVDLSTTTNKSLTANETSLFNNANNIEKRTSSISQSLKNFIIPETNSQLCTIESITARFFGCFGAMYYTAQVWSNLISYYVLNISNEDNVILATNRSCGARYCNFELEIDSDVDSDEISSSTRYLLIGITVALSAAASLLVLIFLDPLDRKDKEEKVVFTLKHAMATLNHLRKKEQLFIISLSMFNGLSQGFYTADFTKAYIQCAWSISYVGLVSVSFGLVCGISSTVSGWLVKFVGRVPLVLLGLALHLGMDWFLLVWHPDAESPYMFHLAAAIWGAQVGIFWSQLQAFYGLLFKKDEEAAFATHYFCSAMGWTISFAYSDYLCTAVKIYILAAFSCCGVVGYLLADRSFRHRNKS